MTSPNALPNPWASILESLTYGQNTWEPGDILPHTASDTGMRVPRDLGSQRTTAGNRTKSKETCTESQELESSNNLLDQTADDEEDDSSLTWKSLEQPPNSRRNDTTMTSANDLANPWADILESLTYGQNTWAPGDIFGHTTSNTGMSVPGDLGSQRKTAENRTDSKEMRTERQKLESSKKLLDQTAEDEENDSSLKEAASRSKKMSRKGKTLADFPPYITTLGWNGRSMFNYEKARTNDGHLTMTMATHGSPRVVRSCSGEYGCDTSIDGPRRSLRVPKPNPRGI